MVAVSLGAGLAAADPAADKILGAQLTAAGHYRVSATSDLSPIPINRIHSWTLHVDTASGSPLRNAQISVSGGMPAHDHGLPTAPRVTKSFNNGDYLLEGVRFHMNGKWEITVIVDAPQGTDSVVFELDL
jgi:hypothetical protein